MRTKLRILTVLVIATALLSACTPAKKVENAELEKNIRLWSTRGTQNYNYRIHKMAPGNASWREMAVQVRNGSPLSKEFSGEITPGMLTDNFTDFDTIEKAFASIQEAYNREQVVSVDYNKERGYPFKIVLNTNRAATDHTVIIELLNFETLK